MIDYWIGVTQGLFLAALILMAYKTVVAFIELKIQEEVQEEA